MPNYFRKSQKAEPYSQLAYIYDYVMRHVNYDDWAMYLNKIFCLSENKIEKVLDISCGTASLALKLRELGFLCAGFDSSQHMVSVAKKKMEENGLRIPVWVSDMTVFSTKQKFDAINCNYDSINYCRRSEEVLKVFSCVANALRPGGFFIFDVSTIRNSKTYFQEYYESEKTGDFEYVRQSYFVRNKKRQVNEFRITRRRDPKISFLEKHEQRIYAIAEIHDIVSSEPFELVGVYDGFTMRPGSEESDRVHFVLRKI